MGWKISDLVPFPLGTWKVVMKPPSKENDSSFNSMEMIKKGKRTILKDESLISKIRKLFKNEDLSSSGPLPSTSDPILQSKVVKLKKEVYHLKIKGNFRRMTLFRFFLAKLLYDKEEGLHFDEFVVMWEIFQEILDQADHDEIYAKKYENFLFESYFLFQALNFQHEFPIRVDESDPETYENLLQKLGPILPTRSAYFGLKGQKGLRSGYSIVFDSDLPLRSLTEQRRIGVGYRDKGSRRNPALDGSPDWREVVLSNSECRIYLVEKLLGVGRESPNFDWDLVQSSEKFPEEWNQEGYDPSTS